MDLPIVNAAATLAPPAGAVTPTDAPLLGDARMLAADTRVPAFAALLEQEISAGKSGAEPRALRARPDTTEEPLIDAPAAEPGADPAGALFLAITLPAAPATASHFAQTAFPGREGAADDVRSRGNTTAAPRSVPEAAADPAPQRAERTAEHATFEPAAAPVVERTTTGKPADPLAGSAQAGLAPPLQLVVPTHTPPTPVAAPAPVRIEVPVASPDWGQELGNRVAWLATERVQSATLQINPPQLGPVEITLTITDDRASVTFVSPHVLVRDAIENSLASLREALAGSGLELGHASVSQDSRAGTGAHPQREAAGSGTQRPGSGQTDMPAPDAQRARPGAGHGLVDTFA